MKAKSTQDVAPSEELHDVSRRIDELTLDIGRHRPKGPPARAAQRLRSICVAYDGSEPSKNALQWAQELGRLHEAKVSVLTVVYPLYMFEHWQEMASASREAEALFQRDLGQSKRLVAAAAQQLRKAGVEASTSVATGFPTEEIPKFGRQQNADLLIVGSHSRGPVARALIGSVADSVKNEVDCDVLVVRTPPGPGPLLAATDGSGESKAAALVGIDLSNRLQRDLHVLYVVEPIVAGYPELAHESTEDALGMLPRPKKGQRVQYQVGLGHPADEIVDYAKTNDCSLILIGSRGLGGLKRLMLGSVSNRVVHRAETNVWITRQNLGREDDFTGRGTGGRPRPGRP